MGRMHASGRGRSGSTKPFVSTTPDWSNNDKSAVEEIILELARKGHTSAEIGLILRDQHAVPNVRLLLGERIGQVLVRNDINPEIPEDLMNLMRKALRMLDHLNGNRKDIHNRRQLELVESRIRRLSRYLKGTGALDSEWVYKRDQLRLAVS
jgi:small subunit ribosomal protein S15